MSTHVSKPAATAVISLGEALVEFMPSMGQSMRQADEWRKYAGGGAATYAAAIARCGRPATLLTLVGEDPFSDYMLDALTQENVDVSHIRRVEARQIGLCYHQCLDGHTSLIFHRQDSAATTLSVEDIDPDLVVGAAALHVPGTTMQISPSALAATQLAISLARKAGVPVSFDPNIRTILGGTRATAAMEQGLAGADVVMPNLEEAVALTGCEDPLQAARELRSRGPRLVAVTLASQGCILLCEGDAKPVHFPGYAVDVVEPTGAGDVHAAALMIGYLAGWELERIGRFANAAGAVAVTAMGHFGAALPTLKRIEQLIDRGP